MPACFVSFVVLPSWSFCELFKRPFNTFFFCFNQPLLLLATKNPDNDSRDHVCLVQQCQKALYITCSSVSPIDWEVLKAASFTQPSLYLQVSAGRIRTK